MFRRLILAGAVGAAVMYFMDAENGTQRRAQALDFIDARLADLTTLVGQTPKETPQLAPYNSVNDMEPASMLNRQSGTSKRSSARTSKTTTPSTIATF